MKILFLGCGKMGSILVENLLSEGSTSIGQITVLKKSEKNKIPGLNYIQTPSSLPKNYQADLVFLTIKPQGSEKILREFADSKIFHKNTIFISILAGKKIQFFEKIFGPKAKIIRSMPNLPIEYQQGVFLYFLNKNIKNSEAKKLKKIFAKFGLSFELKDENLFDGATAIFGSGPAYIFLLQEIFVEIATGLGVKKDAAERLVKKLFLGSALMSEFSEKKFSQLRESVTSKKGTTEAAVKILHKNSALKNLCKKAVDAAIKRSQELSQNDC
jgi:pyrroline-5-carboxylate reductase